MNSEQNLLIQAEKTRRVAIESKIFVYRNLVWAMPWMEHVREKLDDPAYSGFFLNFDRDKYEEWEKLHPNAKVVVLLNILKQVRLCFYQVVKYLTSH